jgi:hypothetical protein
MKKPKLIFGLRLSLSQLAIILEDTLLQVLLLGKFKLSDRFILIEAVSNFSKVSSLI